jgi:hypothetical protein
MKTPILLLIELMVVLATVLSTNIVNAQGIPGIDSRKARRRARKNNDRFGDIINPDLKRELASGKTQLI